MVLVVVHNRYFLCRRETGGVGRDGWGKADIGAGGYKDGESRLKPQPAESSAAPKGRPAPSAPKVQTKLSFKEKFELEQLPERIEALNAAIARDEALLSDPALYARDPAGFERLTGAVADARAKLEAAEERWLKLAEVGRAHV